MGNKDDDDEIGTEIGGSQEGADDDRDDFVEEEQEDTVESLRERLAKQDAALKKANREAARLRTARKPPPKKAAEKDDDAADALEAVEARATARIIHTEAAVAILAAGFQGDRTAARDLAKLVDVAGLELDDNGDVYGLDDAVAALKDQFPRLFEDEEKESRRRRPPPGRVDAARGSVRRTAGRDAPASTAERLGAALRNGR